VLLGAGLRDGVRTGDLVRIGDGEPLGGAESGWVVAEVTTVEEGRSLARAVDPSRRERLAGAASAERLR
jgi:hypothetical protein